MICSVRVLRIDRPASIRVAEWRDHHWPSPRAAPGSSGASAILALVASSTCTIDSQPLARRRRRTPRPRGADRSPGDLIERSSASPAGQIERAPAPTTARRAALANPGGRAAMHGVQFELILMSNASPSRRPGRGAFSNRLRGERRNSENTVAGRYPRRDPVRRSRRSTPSRDSRDDLSPGQRSSCRHRRARRGLLASEASTRRSGRSNGRKNCCLRPLYGGGTRRCLASARRAMMPRGRRVAQRTIASTSCNEPGPSSSTPTPSARPPVLHLHDHACNDVGRRQGQRMRRRSHGDEKVGRAAGQRHTEYPALSASGLESRPSSAAQGDAPGVGGRAARGADAGGHHARSAGLSTSPVDRPPRSPNFR